MTERKVIWCDCSSPDHMAVMELDQYGEETEPQAFVIHIQMTPFRGFFDRLKEAFKYVFGLEQGYHWSETFVSDVKKLKEIRDMVDSIIDHNSKL